MRATKARDVMSQSVVTLSPDMSLQDAWQVLFENKISGAPVVDRDGCLIGVLSQTDLVRELFADGFSEFPSNCFYFDAPFYPGDAWKKTDNKLSSIPVAEAMTKDPICVNVDDSISHLARMMRSKHIHRLIVTDGQKLRGVVSSLDLIKTMELH